jgi:universal stress protein A
MTRIARILVPTDFSAAADAALAYARTIADAFGASIHLLHVFEDPYSAAVYAPEVYSVLPPDFRDAALKDAETRLSERLGTEENVRGGTTNISIGLPANEIVRCAADRDIDLIVMGTHGRSGLAHLLLGSVAERVVRTAPCAVLTVREPRAAGADAGAPEHHR